MSGTRAAIIGLLLSGVIVCAPSMAAPQNAAPAEQAAASTEDRSFAVPDVWPSGRYHLTPSDVIDVSFPYVPEFNQTVTVQPDGYISLRAIGDLRVQGRTLPELHQMLYDEYEPILREPVITIVLREFEKPYFIAAGELKTPGRYELRGTTTLTQAIAVAGGFTDVAKHSEVVLFRRYSRDMLEVKQVNVKRMLASRNLDEDYVIRPGDTVFVPKSTLARLQKFLPTAGLGLYLNPLH